MNTVDVALVIDPQQGACKVNSVYVNVLDQEQMACKVNTVDVALVDPQQGACKVNAVDVVGVIDPSNRESVQITPLTTPLSCYHHHAGSA